MTNKNKKKLLCIYMLSGAFLIVMGALLLINENSIKSNFNNNNGKLGASTTSATCPSGYTLVNGMCYKCSSGTFNSYDKMCYSNATYDRTVCSNPDTFYSQRKCLLRYGKIYYGGSSYGWSSTVTDNIAICNNRSNYIADGSKDSNGKYHCYYIVSSSGGYKCSSGTLITGMKRSATYTQSGSYCRTSAATTTPTKSTTTSSSTKSKNAKSISSCDINIASSSYNYTGGSIKPEPTVTCSGKKLTKGTDYTVSYSNNINVGTATITITGRVNYTGRKVKTFKIVKSSNKAQTPTTPTTPSTTKTYTVTYCNDSKCSKKKTATATYGQVFNLLAYNTFTKTGYTNTKWIEKKSNGKKASWTIENTNNKKWKWNRTSNVTLYASWQAHTYSIVFDKNNKDATGAIADQKIKYGVKKAITKNKYKYKGYKFVKWNTKADGSGKSYTNGQKVSNLSATNGDKIKLYAQWEPVKYTIKFNGNGGKGSMSNISKVYTKDVVAPANKFTRNGYIFTSWNTKRNGKGRTINEGQNIGNLSAKNGSTQTLYAQWANENEKLNLKDGKYIIRKLNTTPAVMKKIKAYKNAKMYSRKKLISDNTKLKTSDTAKLSGKEYIFAIKGDSNGDGKISFPDIVTSYAIYKEKSKKDEYFYASDMDENGKVNFPDIEAMYKMYKTNNNK